MKKINSAMDLAINGASPAFDKPLHVGRPNIGNQQVFLSRVSQMLDNQWLTNNGPLVQEFERQVAAHLGVAHCVAMCNGTIALEIAIRALELTGEVIIPSWTFIATAHALYWQGITPVFADIDPYTHNLSPEAVRRMITPRTSGIIGVHLWGRAAPIEELQAIADEYNLKLMFDAAHAFGSTYQGKKIGCFGSCEVLSFHATKAFNAIEGGAVVTDSDELAEKMRLMRNFGFSGYDNVIYPGTNGKMTEVCAAMGLTNLEIIEDIFSLNKKNYLSYKNEIEDIPGLSLLSYGENEKNSHHYVVVEVGESCKVSRDEIIAALHAENVLARRYFWPGCHSMQPYRELFPHARLLLQETENLAECVIILPNGNQVASQPVIPTIGAILRALVS